MIKINILIVLVGVVTAVSGTELSCHSGFNASLAGVPFYQWFEESCAYNSKCFTQEIELQMSENLDVKIGYGSCVSSSYSDLITCDSLFGPDSKLDPAQMLDMIPDLEKHFNDMITQFGDDIAGKIQELLSGGEGSDEFISGIIRFHENIGFNMDKVKQLQPELTKLFETIFFNASSYQEREQNTQRAIDDLLIALGNLDITDDIATENIYKFIRTFGPQTVRGTKYAPLVEKIPALFKSMLPSVLMPEKWFDVIFEILGDIDYGDPRKSTQDVINTIKEAAQITSEYKMDAIFDSLPELVYQLSIGNISYVNVWSIDLLKSYSTITPATTSLSDSIFDFLRNFGVGNDLPNDLRALIKWVPGYFYQFFSDSAKVDIDKVYGKITSGFNSIDLRNPKLTSPKTKMSTFIVSIFDKIMPAPQNDIRNLLIINFSHMFTDLMSPDYKDELDMFFTTLIDGFRNFPTYNTGKILTDLVLNFGGTVPKEVRPLLDNTQDVINAMAPFNGTAFYVSTTAMIEDYRNSFPESEFPDLVQRYVDYMYKMITTPPSSPEESRKLMQENYEWSIDFYFAILKAMPLNTNDIGNAFLDAFPSYGTYIKVMLALDPADVKQLVYDIINWASAPIVHPVVPDYSDYNDYTDLKNFLGDYSGFGDTFWNFSDIYSDMYPASEPETESVNTNDISPSPFPESQDGWMPDDDLIPFPEGEATYSDPFEGQHGVQSYQYPQSYYPVVYPGWRLPSSESFVAAIKPTVEKITAQLRNLTAEIRHTFAPSSCKHYECDDKDFCNTFTAIGNVTPLEKDDGVEEESTGKSTSPPDDTMSPTVITKPTPEDTDGAAEKTISPDDHSKPSTTPKSPSVITEQKKGVISPGVGNKETAVPTAKGERVTVDKSEAEKIGRTSPPGGSGTVASPSLFWISTIVLFISSFLCT